MWYRRAYFPAAQLQKWFQCHISDNIIMVGIDVEHCPHPQGQLNDEICWPWLWPPDLLALFSNAAASSTKKIAVRTDIRCYFLIKNP